MDNPVVVITGATGVTGALAAQAFAEQGASLALIAHDQQKLENLLNELNLPVERAAIFQADLLQPDQVKTASQAVLEKFGRADILLHLVGGWTGGKTLVETPDADLEAMLNQHLWTSLHVIQALTPSMQENGYGRVIIVSSPLASSPTAKMGAYAIGKAAQEALLMTLAQEGLGSGITTNIILVRSIDTQKTGKGTPPEQIVSTMLDLCSDQAVSINGGRIPLY